MICSECNIGNVVVYSYYMYENPVNKRGIIQRITRGIRAEDEAKCNYCGHGYSIQEDRVV